jgi:hypothetical protein
MFLIERPAVAFSMERLALLQYPVRCRNCGLRTFVGLTMAPVLYHARKARRAKRGENWTT